MAGRDPRSPDPDDWFAEPERAPGRRARASARAAGPSAAEDWIGDDPRARRPRPALAAYLPDGWLPIAAGAGLLVIILIAWLSFGGGGSKPPEAATTTQVATTPAAPTTTAAAPAVPAPTTALKPGDTGPEVKRLQRALVQLGYTVGTIDGDYGTGTKTAVEQFQTASNLTADGLFGTATRTALVAALKG